MSWHSLGSNHPQNLHNFFRPYSTRTDDKVRITGQHEGLFTVYTGGNASSSSGAGYGDELHVTSSMNIGVTGNLGPGADFFKAQGLRDSNVDLSFASGADRSEMSFSSGNTMNLHMGNDDDSIYMGPALYNNTFHLNGGLGEDTLEFRDLIGNFQMHFEGNEMVLTDNRNNTYYISNIEHFKFGPQGQPMSLQALQAALTSVAADPDPGYNPPGGGGLPGGPTTGPVTNPNTGNGYNTGGSTSGGSNTGGGSPDPIPNPNTGNTVSYGGSGNGAPDPVPNPNTGNGLNVSTGGASTTTYPNTNSDPSSQSVSVTFVSNAWMANNGININNSSSLAGGGDPEAADKSATPDPVPDVKSDRG